MSVAIRLSATTVADRKGLRATLAAYAGEVVTFLDNSGITVTGTLTVGDYLVQFDGTDGFTVTVSNGADFVATGVWADDACGNEATKAAVAVG